MTNCPPHSRHPLYRSTSLERLAEKNDLLVQLGLLFADVLRVAESPSSFSDQDVARILARFATDREVLTQRFREFCSAEAGHIYRIQFDRCQNSLYTLLADITYQENATLSTVAPAKFAIAKAAIASVPVTDAMAILPAGSPFSAYCTVRDLFSADATSSILWVDAYLDSSVFHGFLRCVEPSATISLVTKEPHANASRREKDRWQQFLDVSRLFSTERTSQNYQLISHSSGLHDRWLLVDEKKLFALGGSAKDAGKTQSFTISSATVTPEIKTTVQSYLSGGTTLFGLSQPNHV